MGVTSAPECFQYTIQKVLNGLSGVLNMADDIVVFGRDAPGAVVQGHGSIVGVWLVFGPYNFC